MKSYPDIFLDKFAEFLYLGSKKLLSFFIKPDFTVKKVLDIDEDFILKLRNNGIKGIILDIDDTVRTDLKDIPEFNKEWINVIKNNFDVLVLSNGCDINLEKYFNSIGIEYISRAHKPRKSTFYNACDTLSLNPNEIMIIGDGIIPDIHGGNKVNMCTCLVNSSKKDFIDSSKSRIINSNEIDDFSKNTNYKDNCKNIDINNNKDFISKFDLDFNCSNINSNHFNEMNSKNDIDIYEK